MTIPYHISDINSRDHQYVNEVIEQNQLATLGHYTQQCQQWLTEHAKTHKVLLTHSCTAALEMSAILADIQPGDEVIMPSFTFVSTASAVVMRGGIPVFVDVRPDTLNINEALIEAAITERTKAIMPVHYAAVSCAMEKIQDIAKRHQLMVIEDAAQCLFADYQGQRLGSIGDLGCYSFHYTKNVTAGQGGALLINNDALSARAQILLEKGTNRAAFVEGLVDKYTWVDLGSSYTMSEVNAALLWSQLQHSARITQERVSLWQRYYDGLQPCAVAGQLQLPIVPEGCAHNGHIFYVLLPSAQLRQPFMSALREQDIHTVFHYVPLHTSPAGQKFTRVQGDMTHTEELSQRLVRLPLWTGMGDKVDRVIDAVTKTCAQMG